MIAGNAFPFYSESEITFMPTYKYNNGTDDYDTSYVSTLSQLMPFAYFSVRNPEYRRGVIECCEKAINYDKSIIRQHRFGFPTIGLCMQLFNVL